MGCFLVLNAYAGENHDTAAKKLALMFRMAPQQALSIIDKVSKGQVWRFQKEVSDQQAVVAENYLKTIGFQVQRSGQAQQESYEIAETVDLSDDPDVAVAVAVEASPEEPPQQTLQKSQSKALAAQSPEGKSLYFGFHGTGGGLIKIQMVNWILSMITFGIYYFWGKTNERRYLWEQTSFTGDRFFYHGTGKELFKGAMIFNLLFIGVAAGVTVLEKMLGPQMAGAAQGILVLAIWVAIPAILVGAYRYRLSRTAWRGIRFSFRGSRKEAIGLYVKGLLLTLITLGLYWPYFTIARRTFWMRNSHFGNKNVEYAGDGKDIFNQFMICVLLTPLTFGIYWFWYQAFLAQYHWGRTRFAGGTFNFGATGGQMLTLNLVNLLLLAVTLGLAYPWVVVRNLNFVTQHLTIDANMQLDKVVQDAKQSGALAEGAADGMDIDMDFGI
jgi:uncharacterized membrane protein YjgN (DUF898 family)